MTTKQEHAMQLAALLAIESQEGASATTLARVGAKPIPPHMVARDALALLRIGAGVARRAVAACNGEGREWKMFNGRLCPTWTDDDDARKERADEKALAKASEIAARYGATVKIGGDPRGCVFKLYPASGRSNGFAGDGWGVA